MGQLTKSSFRVWIGVEIDRGMTCSVISPLPVASSLVRVTRKTSGCCS